MSGPDLERPFLEVSRRSFLAVGGASVVGLSFQDALAAQAGKTGSVVQIIMTGGASQLDTFDPKPHAPREVRGPLHSIATSIPGVRFSECLPLLAERADRLVIVRSLYHAAAPIHETGLQLLLSGQLVRRNAAPPHVGILLERLLNTRRRVPVSVQLGGRLSGTGTSAYRGDAAGMFDTLADTDQPSYIPDPGSLGAARPDFSKAPRRVRDAYGESRFGELLWSAARLVERGVQYVCVNMFDRIEGNVTWDAHGCPEVGPATVFDYRDTLGPQFDRALAAFLDDLQHSGLWRQTFVACTGEMGRSPRLNLQGGRDHWTQAWSGILAGGLFEGGQVIGETDEHGESILRDPFDVAQIPVLIQRFLGIAPGSEIVLKDGRTFRTPEASFQFS